MEYCEPKWYNFYMSFADKLFLYNRSREELIEKLKSTHPKMDEVLSKVVMKNNNNKPDIDPFTVFALFNQEETKDYREEICIGINKVFKLGFKKTPNSFEGLPLFKKNDFCFYPNGNIALLNYTCFDTLWALFLLLTVTIS